jgi:hypothetical protein
MMIAAQVRLNFYDRYLPGLSIATPVESRFSALGHRQSNSWGDAPGSH